MRSRPLGAEAGHGVRNERYGDCGANTEGNHPLASPAQRRQVVMRLAKLGIYYTTTRHEGVASGCEHYSPGGPQQQLRLQLSLELGHAFTHRRLRDADAPRRGTKAARFDDSQEVANLVQAHDSDNHML
jgi:hypothetical protein